MTTPFTKQRRFHRFEGLIHSLAERTSALAGRFLYKPHVAWWNERSWTVPYERFLETRILDRRFTLVEFAKSVRSLPGCTAEAGVFTGMSSGLICKALEGTYGQDDVHFGFDSFEGLPEPGDRDVPFDRGEESYFALRKYMVRWKKGDLAVRMQDTQSTLAEFPHCRLVKGWIPDCFSVARERSFRFVHIDVDLEAPTRASVEFFYPRVVRGGVILFDDYGLLSCPGARRAVLDYFREVPEPIIELATGQAVVIKQ